VLTYRCVDGLTIEEIEQKLGLSRRQTYREFSKGVDAVVAQLHDLLHAKAEGIKQPAIPPEQEMTMSPSRRELAEAELARLSREMRCEPLDLGDVVQGVCRLLNPRLKQRCIDVASDDLKAMPLVFADRTLLRQALLNLLSYTLDALAEGSHLAFRATEQAGSLRIILKQEHVDKTVGGDAVPAHRREGVALTVAHALIAAQNGSLILNDSPDAWSAEIVLPTAHTPTVLIVDDNQNLVELFHRYLAGHRVTVYGANSGDEALALLRQAAPQAILLDVMMPHQDGWEVLQLLRREPVAAAIPIIVCSVLREQELALSLGASDTLVKPVSQPALLDVLRRWLGTLHPFE
jgi:CheY-like chemotaxis protein